MTANRNVLDEEIQLRNRKHPIGRKQPIRTEASKIPDLFKKNTTKKTPKAVSK